MVEDLRKLGVGPARLVWVRGQDVNDLFVQGKTGQLYVLDTEDGKGERCLLPEVTSYAKPLLSPDGRQIVYTNLDEKVVYALNFDGTQRRKVAEGYASDIWWDPETSLTWVYVRQGFRDTKGGIVRCRLDDPKVVEKVWAAAPTGQPFIAYFQLSRGGGTAVDTFPWPQVGLASIHEGDLSVFGKGCWPGIAPDDSERCFYMTGTHKELVMVDPFVRKTTVIPLTTMPGLSHQTAFHPRWSNHPRVITVTAPEGRPDTELYAGLLNEEATRVEKWVRITHNQHPECFGDAWFALGIQPVKTQSLFARKRTAPTSREAKPGLIFRWENEKAGNAVLGDDGRTLRFCRATLEGEAVPSPWFGAEFRQGTLMVDEESATAVAQSCSGRQSFSLVFSAQATATDLTSSGVLVAMDEAGRQPVLAVEQVGPALFAKIRTEQGAIKQVGLGGITTTESAQWVLVYADGLLECYRNGMMERTSTVRPDFVGWTSTRLRFGSLEDRSQSWQGRLDGVEIYNRPLSPKEAAELHTHEAGNWAQREIPERTVVEAVLEVRSTPSDPVKIAPYTRALVESVWKVKRVVSGKMAAKRVIVLHWCVLGGRSVETVSQTGSVRTLLLEPLEAHPQLQGELRATDILEPDLPVFYEAAP